MFKKLIFISILFCSFSAFALDTESQIYSNAIFEGTVGLVKREGIANKRFCHIARKLKFPNSVNLEVEGGLTGDNSFFAYGTVNEVKGVGFFNSGGLTTGFNLVSGPKKELLPPRGGRAAACGISAVNIGLDKVDDDTAIGEYTEYVSCWERGSGRRAGSFYTCYSRTYEGEFSRVPK